MSMSNATAVEHDEALDRGKESGLRLVGGVSKKGQPWIGTRRVCEVASEDAREFLIWRDAKGWNGRLGQRAARVLNMKAG